MPLDQATAPTGPALASRFRRVDQPVMGRARSSGEVGLIHGPQDSRAAPAVPSRGHHSGRGKRGPLDVLEDGAGGCWLPHCGLNCSGAASWSLAAPQRWQVHDWRPSPVSSMSQWCGGHCLSSGRSEATATPCRDRSRAVVAWRARAGRWVRYHDRATTSAGGAGEVPSGGTE
jgi:hypothetical protein